MELSRPPVTPYVQALIDRENQRQAAMKASKAPSDYEAAPERPRGKKRWVYYQETNRWVEASEIGFEKAIKLGRPVRRSNTMPRKAPEILREPSQNQLLF